MLARRFTQRLRVYIGDGHVDVDLLSATNSRRLGGVREDFGSDGGFEAALDAVKTAVGTRRAAMGANDGLSCDVVIADRWLLYEVIALDVTRVSRSAVNAAMAATLADVTGTRAEALDVRWQWQRNGTSVLAMAMPRPSLARVRALLAQEGLATRSVTGEFVAVFNAQRRRLGAPRVVFAVNRASGAQVALLKEGSIYSTGFEAGRHQASDLARIAVNAMRARGEDTTAEIDYVVDAGAPLEAFGAPPAAAASRWSLVNSPERAAAA